MDFKVDLFVRDSSMNSLESLNVNGASVFNWKNEKRFVAPTKAQLTAGHFFLS